MSEVSTEVVFSTKTPLEPTTTTFTGWGYSFFSVKLKRGVSQWTVYGIDSDRILRILTCSLDFTNPILLLEVLYLRNFHAMCFGPTKETFYFCARDKLCKWTNTVTEICSIRGESFSHMAYSDGFIYVTTNVGIDLYNESLQLFQYTYVPTLSFHRLYGIVVHQKRLYVQTNDTLFSIPIQSDGMLSPNHRVLLTGLSVNVDTFTGIEMLTQTVTSTQHIEPTMNTLCFSSYSNGMNNLCFYSLEKPTQVYFAVSSLFTVSDLSLYFYTPTEWKERGPVSYPVITGYEKLGATSYRLTGTDFEEVLDVFFQDTLVVFDKTTATIQSSLAPRVITMTNGFFTFVFYTRQIDSIFAQCIAGDIVEMKGTNLNTVTQVKVGTEIVSVYEKSATTLSFIAPILAYGAQPVEVEGILLEIQYVTYNIRRISKTVGKMGDILTVFGKGLEHIASIRFGDYYADFTLLNDTELRVTVPFVVGIVPIRFNQQPGKYITGQDISFYNLSIQSNQVLKGMAGDILLIRGSNLLTVNEVSFGTEPADLVERHSTFLQIRIPYSEIEEVFIEFNQSETRDLSNAQLRFQYVPYEIKTISTYLSNEQVTFEGKGLMKIISASFGTMPSTLLQKQYDSITLSLPSQTTESKVVVNFRDPTTSLTTYVDQKSIVYTYIPILQSMSKNRGIQGETITFSGQYLNNLSELFFGSERAELSNRTFSSIFAMVPNGKDTLYVRGRVSLDVYGTRNLDSFLDGSRILFQYLMPTFKCYTKDKVCHKAIYSYPSNQLSTKILQASMIRNHAKITYNNSRLKTVYNLMLGLDYVINRNLLFQYKYRLYSRYLNELLRGNINQSVKEDLSNMIQTLVSSLTPAEYRFVFDVILPPPVVVPDVIVDSTYTFYVIQRKMTNRSYFVFKNLPTNLLLETLTFYIFDVSDPSNLNTVLSFSEEKNGIPYRGIEYISTPGTEGAKVILSIYKDIQSVQLFVYNAIERSPIIQYRWGYSIESILVHLDNSVVQEVANFLYINARQYSYLSVYESSGPKYSINDSLNPVVFLEFNQYRYKLSYGTYYLEIPKTYSATLLNKGYEEYISFIGDTNKRFTENVIGLNLLSQSTPVQEGIHDFYYGRVRVTVYKPLPFDFSFYSRTFGFMGGMKLIQFSSQLEPTDTSALSLPFMNTLNKGSLIRLNGDTSLNRTYGLSMGTYILTIDPSMNIAFMNDGKEDLFEVAATSGTVTTGPFLAPDSRSYTFYSGRINLVIKGWFEFISVCTRSGYSGGYKLFAYNAYNGPSYTYVYRSIQTRKGLCAENNIYLYDNKQLYFNDDHNLPSPSYGLYNGVYTIFNIPSACPITFLNKNKENLVMMESLTNTTRAGTSPDGTLYTFYYGTLRFKVQGNFGQMSIYTLFNGYMGAKGIFTYDETFDNRISYPDVRSIPVIIPVAPNTTYVENTTTADYVPLRILLSEGLPLVNTTPYSNLYIFPVVYNVVNLSTTIAFNSESPDANKKYVLKNGIYILDSSEYITLLNAGNDRIQMIGVLSRTTINSEGNKYTYYKGNTIAIYVYGNFGLCSLEALSGVRGNYILCHEDNLTP